MSGQDGKPFAKPKSLVWQTWKRVKANGCAAGADGMTTRRSRRILVTTFTRSGYAERFCGSPG
jgi:hypothetical protein